MKEIYQVEDSNITLDSIKQKEYYPKELDNEICSADALFIPFENFRDDYDILFAEGTKELFQYLRKAEQKIEVIVKDEDFKEIELHDSSYLISTIFFSVFSPIILNLISNYIYDKILNSGKKTKDINVKVDIHCEKTKTKKQVKVKYDGPADKMEECIKTIFEEFNKDGK